MPYCLAGDSRRSGRTLRTRRTRNGAGRPRPLTISLPDVVVGRRVARDGHGQPELLGRIGGDVADGGAGQPGRGAGPDRAARSSLTSSSGTAPAVSGSRRGPAPPCGQTLTTWMSTSSRGIVWPMPCKSCGKRDDDVAEGDRAVQAESRRLGLLRAGLQSDFGVAPTGGGRRRGQDRRKQGRRRPDQIGLAGRPHGRLHRPQLRLTQQAGRRDGQPEGDPPAMHQAGLRGHAVGHGRGLLRRSDRLPGPDIAGLKVRHDRAGRPLPAPASSVTQAMSSTTSRRLAGRGDVQRQPIGRGPVGASGHVRRMRRAGRRRAAPGLSSRPDGGRSAALNWRFAAAPFTPAGKRDRHRVGNPFVARQRLRAASVFRRRKARERAGWRRCRRRAPTAGRHCLFP